MPAISLLGATFSKRADFIGVTFSGKTYFQWTTFDGEVSFWEARFGKEASFLGARFSGETYFQVATFDGRTDFSGATFSEKAYFLRATFNGEAIFQDAKFNEEADFRAVPFFGPANFLEATFSEKVHFSRAAFKMATAFLGVTFKEADFSKVMFTGETNFLGINIKERIRFEKANLEKVSFLDTDLRKIDFINCDWPKRGGRNVLYDEIELFKKEKGKDFKDKIKKVEILYRQLKQKYKEEHNEPEVSNWHYGEKEMQRKQSSIKGFSFYLLHPYWLSIGYGEKPARAGIFLLFLLLYTSLFLAVVGLVVPDNVKDVHGITSIGWPYDIDIKKTWALFLNTLKYVTFQRDPFFEPANWVGEAIKLLAQILIPLQTALFALAVRNRFRR